MSNIVPVEIRDDINDNLKSSSDGRQNALIRSEIKYENTISTSNLSSYVFREIVCMLGLEYKPYETKEVLIDEKLLKRRNQIAHGKFLDINCQDYNELHKQVVGILDTFRNQIDNCASTKKYSC